MIVKKAAPYKDLNVYLSEGDGKILVDWLTKLELSKTKTYLGAVDRIIYDLAEQIRQAWKE